MQVLGPILRGSTSVLITVFIQNVSLPGVQGLTGLAYNTSGLVAAYRVRGNAGGATAISLVTATIGTWASGGFVEIDSTNMPGFYELGVPNAAFTSALNAGGYVDITLLGASNMPAPVAVKIPLTATNIAKNASLNAFSFQMTDATTYAPKTGLTVSGQVSIDGAAYTNLTNAVSEVGNGTYKVNLAAADTNGNVLNFKFTATGANQCNVVEITQS